MTAGNLPVLISALHNDAEAANNFFGVTVA